MIEFIPGWWHAADLASAVEVIGDALAALGLAPIDAATLAMVGVDDEEEARRRQIGIAAQTANAQLATAGRPERVRAYRESDASAKYVDPDEPVWLVVSDGEHTALLAELGPPDELEAAYDAGRKPPPVSPRMPRSNVERWLYAQARIDARDYAAAIATIDAILASGYDQHDVVLIELAKIGALRSASRHDEARAYWRDVATAWLAGKRRVWQSQWTSLGKLQARLKLVDDAVAAQIRERAATAPQ